MRSTSVSRVTLLSAFTRSDSTAPIFWIRPARIRSTVGRMNGRGGCVRVPNSTCEAERFAPNFARRRAIRRAARGRAFFVPNSTAAG